MEEMPQWLEAISKLNLPGTMNINCSFFTLALKGNRRASLPLGNSGARGGDFEMVPTLPTGRQVAIGIVGHFLLHFLGKQKVEIKYNHLNIEFTWNNESASAKASADERLGKFPTALPTCRQVALGFISIDYQLKLLYPGPEGKSARKSPFREFRGAWRGF